MEGHSHVCSMQGQSRMDAVMSDVFHYLVISEVCQFMSEASSIWGHGRNWDTLGGRWGSPMAMLLSTSNIHTVALPHYPDWMVSLVLRQQEILLRKDYKRKMLLSFELSWVFSQHYVFTRGCYPMVTLLEYQLKIISCPQCFVHLFYVVTLLAVFHLIAFFLQQAV